MLTFCVPLLVGCALVASVEPSSPLSAVERALAKGNLDAVVAATGDPPADEDEQARLGELLVRAAQLARSRRDEVLSLFFAQRAVRFAPKSARAHEAAAEVSLRQGELEMAERYCDTWVELEPQSARARLLWGEIALAKGDWIKALGASEDLEGAALDGSDVKRVQKLQRGAAALQKKFEAEGARLRQLARNEASRVIQDDGTRPAPARAKAVVLYGTAWCNYCRKARAYLSQRGVAFGDRDIERDAGAKEELDQKLKAAGLRFRGVPVIVIDGELLIGFDEGRLRSLLEDRPAP